MTGTTQIVHEKIEKQDKFVDSEPTLSIAHFISQNDIEGLKRFLEGMTDPNSQDKHELINSRDESGKSPLDLAASLGRTEMTSLLIQNGADVNLCTSKGYNSLHYAAAWGHLSVLTLLIKNSGNLNQKTIFGETSRDVATRYNQQDCANFLALEEERDSFQAAINSCIGKIQDMDKSLAGKITRDEKNTVINTCKRKQAWLNSLSDTSLADIKAQHEDLDEITQPILIKLSEAGSALNVQISHQVKKAG